MVTKRRLFGLVMQILLLNAMLVFHSLGQRIISVNDAFIEVGFEQASMMDIISEIENKTDYQFIYFTPDLQSLNGFDLIDQPISVGNLLLKLSEDFNLAFKQLNNRIIVKGRETRARGKSKGVEVVIARTITGKVTGLDTNDGLPGVNIVIKGSTQGTVSDLNGYYKIDFPENEKSLVYSSVGYQTQEVEVGRRNIVNVDMDLDVTALGEIVVVGYGAQKKTTVTGSIATLKGESLKKSPATNLSNSLVGRLPGLISVTRSGEPGYDDSTIRIRGVNTLNDSDVLIVVDGVPGRSLSRIDPATIEDVTLLKDASAAIYGSQAANGVILVTTKRGKVGKPVLSLNYNIGFNRPTRIPEMTNSSEYATLLNEIDVSRGNSPRYSTQEIQKFADGSDPWKYPNTDWFAETLKPWSPQRYGNISLSGGSDNLRYYLLLGGKSQDGYYYHSATIYHQYNFRSNIDADINDNVSIGFDLAGRLEDRNFPTRAASDVFWMLMRGKPNLPAYWPNGLPGPDIEYGHNPVVIGTPETGYDRDKWYFMQSNFRLDIKIPAIEGLSIKTNASIDKGFRFRKVWETPWYLYTWDYQSYDASGEPLLVKSKRGREDPSLFEETEDNMNILLNARINYEKIFGQHMLNFMIGTERRSGQGERFSAFRRHFISTAIDQLSAGAKDSEINNSGTGFNHARLNYFGRINYNYRLKYLLEFVWRLDGSYIFPENHRFGFFPGVSAGWRISDEDFWKNDLSIINDFKLRASWGQTGNDRIDAWQYLSAYTFNQDNYSYVFGVDEENKLLSETVIPNPNVTWEVANQFNAGFEAEFINSKFFLNVDYFINKRSQILWSRNASVPASTGLSLPSENIGKVTNKGFEFSLGLKNNTQDFYYVMALNGGYSKGIITFWDEAPGAPSYQQSTGKPIPSDPYDPNNDLYYQALGVFPNQEAIDNYPSWEGAVPGDIIFEDVNEDGVIDANDRVRSEKSNIPRFTGGMSFDMTYKNFDLSVLFQGAVGAVRYNHIESGEIGNYLKDFYDNRWTPENPNASQPRTYNRDEQYWRNQRNTLFLKKTDYIRLKTFELGYNLPESLNEKLGFTNFRIYVSGFNLFTYSPDLKDFDPESDNDSARNYPLQKVINSGVNITF